MEGSSGRRREEDGKDERGRQTIWEGKYLPIHLLERDHATHLCRVAVCVWECVCVLYDDNVRHTSVYSVGVRTVKEDSVGIKGKRKS